jgi:hypothetical protein
MRIYTVFTESHYDLFKNYFIPSFPFDINLELVVKFKPQACPSSEFQSEGWRDTMKYKVQCFIDAAYETPKGECFMFTDPDIQFFKPFSKDVIEQLGDADAAFQNDYGGGVNTGFFIMRSTSQTRAFLKTVEGNLEKFPEEQVCFNYLINNFHMHPKISFPIKMLDKNYWTYGEYAIKRASSENPAGTWQGHEDFDIPKDIVMHHGNWTVPFANKIKLMDVVKQKYNARKI